jgi:uncharacterized protein (TIGR02001 family)
MSRFIAGFCMPEQEGSADPGNAPLPFQEIGMLLHAVRADIYSNLGFRKRRLSSCAKLVFTTVLSVGLTANAAGAADKFEIGTDVTLATDYMFRGISQTMSSPAVHGCLEVTHDSGLSAYLWASNVDFVADGDPDDGARVEMDLMLGYTRALSDRFTASANHVLYFFPGRKPGFDYDYSEWVGSLAVDDRHSLSLGYAPDVFGAGESGVYVAAATSFDLPGDLLLSAEIGHYDLEAAYGESYRHGSVGISRSVDSFTWQLSYHVTDNKARNLFYESIVAPKLVLSLNLTL